MVVQLSNSDTLSFAGHPGSLRPSQLITTFGPGALVQMEHDSVIVMGADMWAKDEKHYRILHHPDLEWLLEKDHFRMPYPINDAPLISCVSFPQWGVCSSCCSLQRHGSSPPAGSRVFACSQCDNGILHSASFVSTCAHGHLDEFPWVAWAHSSREKVGEPCSDNPHLMFGAYGKNPGLSDCYVRCNDCGATRHCGGATSYDGLAELISECTGRLPWLGDKTESCRDDDGSRTLMRGVQTLSTSLYYPSVVSALRIPKWLHPVQKIIDQYKKEINGMLSMQCSLADIAAKSTVFEDAKRTYGEGAITTQLEKRFILEGQHTDKEENYSLTYPEHKTQQAVRSSEYDDLMSVEFNDADDDGYLEISDVTPAESISEYVDVVKKISRITEIRVIRAFLRGEAPDPYSEYDEMQHNYCKITQNRTDWYPAIENRGEGFLFRLREDKLKEWAQAEGVQARCGAISAAYDEWSGSRRGARDSDGSQGGKITISPRHILLHTLAHAMIRTASTVSGYNEASIRERIYPERGQNGILLYTAGPASDGSLGGLVRQSRPANFERLLKAAVARSQRCSRDPLCAEDPLNPERNNIPAHARLNGSACYGCMLLPETSCENMNRVLDRALLCDDDVGFFRGW